MIIIMIFNVGIGDSEVNVGFGVVVEGKMYDIISWLMDYFKLEFLNWFDDII